MPTTKSFRFAWIACAFFALPVLAQEPAATPPAEVPAADAAAAPADAAASADAPATTDAAVAAPADGAGEPPADTRALDETVQDLKKDVVDLNKELFVLEEELLFPANTQVAVFVSMDIGEFFALDSLSLKIDNKEVANYMYTPREAEALLKGGVHRVYLGNLKVGDHQLVAFFSGKGPNERDYKRGANLKFEKGVGAKYLELKITDRQRKAQPEFAIKDWE
ncbi:MAG: AraC family transcriptional regulator [Pseudomonadota bacterium]